MVKVTKPGEVLVLDRDKDSLFQITQDAAKVLAILSENGSHKAVAVEYIQTKLAEVSPVFRKHKYQREGLIGLLQVLQKDGILEKRV